MGTKEKVNQNCNIDSANWQEWHQWLRQPSGNYIRAWEQNLLDTLTVDIFGFNAVQIGMPQMDCLAASRMPKKWLSNDTIIANSPRKIALLHDFAELPFDSQSIDLVVLPHVLEFAREPHQVLREVERVLIPEGRLIICGFNATSLWGARQAIGRMAGRYYLPRSGDFISLSRLKDWLKLLNMEVDRGHFGGYAPPIDSEKWLQRFHFIEGVGERWWPYMGAVYVVQAIKRVKGMHLIGPVWKQKKLRVPNAVPVTNRHHSERTD